MKLKAAKLSPVSKIVFPILLTYYRKLLCTLKMTENFILYIEVNYVNSNQI
jgi:hypothetical protein